MPSDNPSQRLYVFTRRQVREVDRVAIEEYGIPGIVLMENAARGVAEHALAMLPPGGERRVLVICGGGNNGGDGLAAARHLHNTGMQTTIVLMRPPNSYSGDAATNLRICVAMGLPITDASTDPLLSLQRLGAHDLVLDGLLGSGLSDPVREPLIGVVEWINEHRRAAVLAIDIPSGLDCDTGRPLGAAVRADATVTFVGMKRGFLAPGAGDYTGTVHVIGIGAPREVVERLGEPMAGIGGADG